MGGGQGGRGKGVVRRVVGGREKEELKDRGPSENLECSSKSRDKEKRGRETLMAGEKVKKSESDYYQCTKGFH